MIPIELTKFEIFFPKDPYYYSAVNVAAIQRSSASASSSLTPASPQSITGSLMIGNIGGGGQQRGQTTVAL